MKTQKKNYGLFVEGKQLGHKSDPLPQSEQRDDTPRRAKVQSELASEQRDTATRVIETSPQSLLAQRDQYKAHAERLAKAVKQVQDCDESLELPMDVCQSVAKALAAWEAQK